MLHGEVDTWDRRRVWGSGAFRCAQMSPHPLCWAWCVPGQRCRRRCACIAGWSCQTGPRPCSAHSGSWWKGLHEIRGTAEGLEELIKLVVGLDYFPLRYCTIVEELVDGVLDVPLGGIEVRDGLFLRGLCGGDKVFEELLLLLVQRFFLLCELASTMGRIWTIISIKPLFIK